MNTNQLLGENCCKGDRDAEESGAQLSSEDNGEFSLVLLIKGYRAQADDIVQSGNQRIGTAITNVDDEVQLSSRESPIGSESNREAESEKCK